jgi:hypothetical protein
MKRSDQKTEDSRQIKIDGHSIWVHTQLIYDELGLAAVIIEEVSVDELSLRLPGHWFSDDFLEAAEKRVLAEIIKELNQ